jgi:hypothetical protein
MLKKNKVVSLESEQRAVEKRSEKEQTRSSSREMTKSIDFVLVYEYKQKMDMKITEDEKDDDQDNGEANEKSKKSNRHKKATARLKFLENLMLSGLELEKVGENEKQLF